MDVCYGDDTASVAALTFENWQDAREQDIYLSEVQGIQEYVSGQFYRRELPCILHLLEEYELNPELIVIDGFVYLDGVAKPGLGKYLYDALHGRTAVIGVAKNPLKGLAYGCEVYRGSSQKPLYVTSAGIEPQLARQNISAMHGSHRVPSLLKKVDQLCRQG